MRRIGFLVLGTLSLLLVGLGRERPPLDGARVYQENCGRCHNPRSPADLGEDGWRAVSFHMRVKANLTPQEFEALERFLVPPTQQPPAGSFGNELADAQCLRCHDGERIRAAIDADRDQSTWTATLDCMVLYGATITPEEKAELASWLAEQAD